MKSMVILCAVALMNLPFAVKADEITIKDRFDLWNECEPIELVVSADGGESDGKARAEVLVRSRLRAARIFNASGQNAHPATLNLHVSPIRKAMIWKIKQVVHRHGLRLRPDKEASLISAPADITGVIVRDERTLLPNRQLKALAELKQERRLARNPEIRQRLDRKIAGRLAQRAQVEARS